MNDFFWAVQIYPVWQTLENFICKWIYQMFLSPNAFMVCPVGEGGGPVTEWGHCLREAGGQALSSSEQELACSKWARKGMHIPCVLGNSPLEQSNLQSQLISEHNFMPCLEKEEKKRERYILNQFNKTRKLCFCCNSCLPKLHIIVKGAWKLISEAYILFQISLIHL